MADQLDDMVYYMARALDLPDYGTHVKAHYKYDTEEFDVFRIGPDRWMDPQTGMARVMRNRDQIKWNKNPDEVKSARAWLMIGRAVLNNRKILQHYLPQCVPMFQELMAMADLIHYQPTRRFRRVHILLDLFEGHRMLPDTLQRIVWLAVYLEHYRDAALYIEGGLQILEDVSVPLPPDTISPLRNRQMFPPQKMLDQWIERFTWARELLRSTVAVQAQTIILYGDGQGKDPEPVHVDEWVVNAFLSCDTPEQITQLGEDLFFEGLVSQDIGLVNTVLIEMAALQLAPTDDMWASLLRTAKYSGQYTWNVAGPAVTFKAYTGSYLNSRMLPMQARQRRELQLQQTKLQSITERQLCDEARWNRLRAIKRSMGYSNLHRLKPYHVPTQAESHRLGLPPLFIPYPELSFGSHRQILRGHPIGMTPNEHHDRILRNQHRRWLLNVVIGMVHGTYELKGQRLRLLRQFGLWDFVHPIKSKLSENTECAQLH